MAKLNLYDLLQKKSYDHAVICSYTFDPNFFEDYCLTKFNSLINNGNINIIVDRFTYEKIILGPAQYRPKQANLRYLFHPVSVPGAFHTKLFLFVSESRGRLVLGSANFTRPGITSNAELINSFDYEIEKDESFQPLFQSVFAFLMELSKKWPSEILSTNLRTIVGDAPWLNPQDGISDHAAIEFRNNLTISLWEQLISKISGPVDSIYILSRYFDADPSILDKVQKDLHPKTIKIFTQNGITTLTKEWLTHPLVTKGTAKIFICEYTDEEHIQNLHAKAIAIETNKKSILAFGSANFTTTAMFKSSDRGNVEILLILPDLARKSFKPELFFDPDKTAIHIKDKSLLHTSTIEPEDFQPEIHEITLLEAILDEGKIHFRAFIPAEVSFDRLLANLEFQDGAYKSVILSSVDDKKFQAKVSEEIIQRLHKASSTVKLEVFKGEKKVGSSNSILIINLLDIETGKSVRHDRRIKQAQQDITEFFNVLSELENDEDELMIFLTFCDIKIQDVYIPSRFRPFRPEWDSSKGMRKLGERNLRIFNNLHDASISFLDRHFRRLESHVKHGGLNGIPNFMHIFLSMGRVLMSQLERARQGFESKTNPMSSDEWYNYRKYFDEYFEKFRNQIACLQEYLEVMVRDYGSAETKKRLDPEDLAMFQSFCKKMFDFRGELEPIRVSKLKVKTSERKILIPAYFNDNIFYESRWLNFTFEVERMLNNVKSLVSG